MEWQGSIKGLTGVLRLRTTETRQCSHMFTPSRFYCMGGYKCQGGIVTRTVILPSE